MTAKDLKTLLSSPSLLADVAWILQNHPSRATLAKAWDLAKR